jgi:hypothetical protein
MTNGTEYSFMRPYTRGSSDMDGLANALRRGEHEPLDKYKRDPYVELRCSIPWVKDRGHLDFRGEWDTSSSPPGDTALCREPSGPSDSSVIVGLTLTRGASYLATLDVACGVQGSNPGFRISGWGWGIPAGWVDAHPFAQTIVFTFSPPTDSTAIFMDSVDLKFWYFYTARLFEHI